MMEEFYKQRFRIVNKQETNRRLGLEEEDSERLLRLEQENTKAQTIQDEIDKKVSLVDSGKQSFEPQSWKPAGNAKGRRGSAAAATKPQD